LTNFCYEIMALNEINENIITIMASVMYIGFELKSYFDSDLHRTEEK
jgi:hypothetical protein